MKISLQCESLLLIMTLVAVITNTQPALKEGNLLSQVCD